MRKNIKLFIGLLLLFCVLAACSEVKNEKEPTDPALVLMEDAPWDPDSESLSSTPGIDVDLTAMSSTMVFAKVYDMLVQPESYVGKTIKMQGQYAAFYDETAETYYHAVIIADATACCSQGLEFVWKGEHTYPDDYPEEYSEIEVTGVFQPIEEGEYTFYYIETDGYTPVSP